MDSDSVPGYKKHKKVPYTATRSDGDPSTDKKESKNRKKRRGRPAKRQRRSPEDWDTTDTEEEEERELKMELKELGVKGLYEKESDSDISSSGVEEEVEEEKTERVQEKPIECEVIVKTAEEISDEDESDEADEKEEVFPKKCNLCCENFNDKQSMIEHIRNKHIVKSNKNSEGTKPKFEIIRQKPSKCLDVILEETAKRK